MPNPNRADLHINRALTQMSIAYMQKPEAFVADRVFPNIPVQKQSDKYFRYDRSDFWRNSMKKRANGAESAGSGWKIDSTPTYFAEVFALHKDISENDRANADDPLDMDRDAMLYLSQQALISREVEWASTFLVPNVWKGIDGSNGDVTGVAGTPSGNQVKQWNDSASTPVADVKKYMRASQKRTGYKPNKFVIGPEVWDLLSEHPDLKDRIKYGSSNDEPAVVSLEAFAAMCGLDEVLVAEGIQVTSKENPSFETSMTTSFIAGKVGLLCYANPTPSIMMPSAGYSFSWVGKLGAGNKGQRIKKWWMDEIESDRVEMEMAYDQKVVAPDCGVFFQQLVA